METMIGKNPTLLYPWDQKPSREDPHMVPEVDFKLAYVPSYNGRNTRHNILFIAKNEIAFTVSF